MNESVRSEELDKLLSLNKEEINKLFAQLSLSEIEDLLDKLSEVKNND